MRPPLEFFVNGHPAGQPRVKATAFRGHARVYTPTTVKDASGVRRAHPAFTFKNAVRAAAERAWKAQDCRQWEGPLCVDLTFYFERPKSHLRSNGQLKVTAPKWHTVTPDWDNCAKLVLDALTGIGLWVDDKQVCDGRAQKRYVNFAMTSPGVAIRISEASL